MLFWALIFLIITVVACIFGFGGISAVFATGARFLFFIFGVDEKAARFKLIKKIFTIFRYFPGQVHACELR